MPFAGSDHYLGPVFPADVNADAAIDFVVPQRHAGPDNLYGTADDVAMLVTLLNTTPAGPLRCRPRATTVGTLPARTLYVGAGAVAVVVPVATARAVDRFGPDGGGYPGQAGPLDGVARRARCSVRRGTKATTDLPDSVVRARVTAIKAVHVAKLRDAILALE